MKYSTKLSDTIHILIFIALGDDEQLSSTQLFPHEKLRLILNITHKTQTPLTLIHHLLEEIISDSLSESTSQKVKRILRYTSHIMSCYQNIAVFDDKENELHPVSFLSCDTLGTQLLVTGKQQIKTTGNGKHQFFFLVFDLLNVYQKSGDDRILFIILQHAVSEFPPLVTASRWKNCKPVISVLL